MTSPVSALDIATVKAGAELLTVSVKETSTKNRAIRPRRTVAYL